MTEYPESFVDDKFELFGPDGEEIKIRSFPGGGTASGVSHPAKLIRANGGKAGSRSFYRIFNEPGTYKLVFKFKLNAANKPAKMTTQYKSIDSKTELTFEVVERKGIPLEVKEIDYETFKKQTLFKDLSKTNDSTNVFNIAVNGVDYKGLEEIAKFKNLKGLKIQTDNLLRIPDAIFQLNLFELNISLTATQTINPVDLSKITNFKNLRKLRLYITSEVIIPEDFSCFEHLQTLGLVGFKNEIIIESLPKANLSVLYFASLAGLKGISGDFSEFKKLGKLSFASINNFVLPKKISGNIWDLTLLHGPFNEFPDLSGLKLSRINFYPFTGESLPVNFETYLKKSAQVSFPNRMYKSKDYKKLKKLGFNVFPKSK
ncbi:MAG: hypothetical protein COA33_007875 [Fluviicola sp.]|nr:hypothetical protein [Fluviicola sp.]